jgi:hypothetical protein
LLHDILGRSDSLGGTRADNAKSSFGIGQPDVSFLGYWVLQPEKDPSVKDLKISAWVRANGTALVTVGNLGSSDYFGNITLPFGLLGVSRNTEVCDGETGTGNPLKFTKLATGSTVNLTVLSHDCRILLVGPDGVFK